MPLKVNYCSVEERDMDTLFLEAIGTDNGFLQLFLNKVDALKDCKDVTVLDIQLSKTDDDGESDITVIIQANNKKIGLLIEDKINAVAMDEQCNRYSIRGEKGIKNKDYDEFFVFIVAPTKYYELNDEAKKYDYYVSYEECKEYFEAKDNVISNIWKQQIEQAIEKGKKQGNVTYNPQRMDFLKKYIEYQKIHYPEKIVIANNPDNKGAGGWVQIKVNLKNACIYHKADKACMDLTIPGAKEKSRVCKSLLEYLHKLGYEKLICTETGNSIAFRYEVPVIKFDEPFNDDIKKDLDICFEKAEKLVELAELINDFAEVAGGKNK